MFCGVEHYPCLPLLLSPWLLPWVSCSCCSCPRFFSLPMGTAYSLPSQPSQSSSSYTAVPSSGVQTLHLPKKPPGFLCTAGGREPPVTGAQDTAGGWIFLPLQLFWCARTFSAPHLPHQRAGRGAQEIGRGQLIPSAQGVSQTMWSHAQHVKLGKEDGWSRECSE